MEVPQNHQRQQEGHHASRSAGGQEDSNQVKIVSCPVCNNEMTFIQTCHLRCMVCGAELSCEDKGWFWG